MPFSAIIAEDNDCSILRAGNRHGGRKRRLFVLGIVQGIFRHFHVIVLLELVFPEIGTARPAKNKEAEEAKQEQEARFGRLIQLNIGGMFYNGTGLVLRSGVRIHRVVEGV